MRAASEAKKFIEKQLRFSYGPFGTAVACKHCPYTAHEAGKGFAARSRLLALGCFHLKAAHPAVLEVK